MLNVHAVGTKFPFQCRLAPRRWPYVLLIPLLVIYLLLWCSNLIDESQNRSRCSTIQRLLPSAWPRLNDHVMQSSTRNSTTVHLSMMIGGAEASRQAVTLIKSVIYHLKPNARCQSGEPHRHGMRFSRPGTESDVILHLHFVVDQAAHISLQSIFDSWMLPGVRYDFYNFDLFRKNVSWIPSKHYSGQFGCGKLLLTEILPADLHQVISLDVDLLLNADIRELWDHFDHFTTSNMIGMAPNQSPWYKLTFSKSVWPAINYGYNTGVMLLDLDKMRKTRWAELWPRITREQVIRHDYVYLADQDIINAIIVQHPNVVHDLPCVWNVQLNGWNESMRCNVRIATDDGTADPNQPKWPSPKIVHFNTPQKPETLLPGQVFDEHSFRIPKEKQQLRQFFVRRYHMIQEYDGKWIKDRMVSLTPNRFSDQSFHAEIQPSICAEFEADRRLQRRIHPFYLSYNFSAETKEMLLNDVTLLSQLSFDRIQRLEQLVSNWPGPVSLALHLSEREARVLSAFVIESAVLSRRQNIGFHIVFSEGPFYPINELRNVALTFARTNSVFHLDVDFIPSANLYESIRKNLKNRLKSNSTSRSVALDSNTGTVGVPKDCFVVPAFETFDTRFQIPSTKSDLLVAWDRSSVVPFRHQIWTRGHLATNYTRWRNATAVYEVQWSADYEPYVVTDRSAPALDPRFVGFGWNKASYSMVLDALGYRFLVLPDAFVLHMPHPPSIEMFRYRSSQQYRYCVDKMKLDFIKQLAKQFGVQALKYLEFRKEEPD